MKKYSLLLLGAFMVGIAGCAHDGVYVGYSSPYPYYSGFWGPDIVWFGGGGGWGHHHHHWH